MPKFGGTPFAGAHNEHYNIWGVYIGVCYFGKLPFGSRSVGVQDALPWDNLAGSGENFPTVMPILGECLGCRRAFAEIWCWAFRGLEAVNQLRAVAVDLGSEIELPPPASGSLPP